MPLLTIGLPVHNGQAFIAACLESLLAQSFGDFEIVIGDNASNDATREIYESYAAKDRRISVIRNAHNLGAAGNFNMLARECRSKYFKWAAADDLLDPTYLKKCIDVLEKSDQTILCHTKTIPIGSDGNPLQQDPDTHEFMAEYGKLRLGESPDPLGSADDVYNRFQSVAIDMIRCFDIFGIIRNSALAESNLFGPYYGCDRVLLIELSMKGRFHRIEEPLFFKREHADQSSNLADDREKQRWIASTSRAPMPFVIPREIIARVLRSNLAASQKARCLWIYLNGANWGRLLNTKASKTYRVA